MPRIDRGVMSHFDWFLFLVMTTLIAMGVANLYSATYTGAEGGLSSEVRRQLASIAVAAAGFVVILGLDYRRFERLAIPIYIVTCLLVASTLVLAPLYRGNRSWLIYGPLRLQPSELVKVGLVLLLARYFQRRPPSQITRLRDLWRPALIVALPVSLILLQRDMGVALLTLLIGATYLPLVKIPWRAWGGVMVAALAALASIWFFALRAYQRSRILDFLEPGRDPLDSGYQAIQSRIAIGSGGMFGKGWLEGSQTQLKFLPTQHTDFIFSVLAEEWGFVGSALVLGLYVTMLLWGLFIARRSKDHFGAMVAVGVVGILFWPAVVNVSMVLGLAPVIGVPLPLFSYGGSAMVASVTALALLLSVSMRRYMF